MDLNGKRILITGASSGLGRELAYQFSRKGNVDLILVARRKEALDKVAKKMRKPWKSYDWDLFGWYELARRSRRIIAKC